MLEQIKRIAAQTDAAGVPTMIMFGVVKAASPLTIYVDNRFEINESAIILPREFRAGALSTHTHTVSPHSHTIPGADSTGDSAPVTAGEVYHGLTVGEKLVLLRNHGGQEYLVLGRL